MYPVFKSCEVPLHARRLQIIPPTTSAWLKQFYPNHPYTGSKTTRSIKVAMVIPEIGIITGSH